MGLTGGEIEALVSAVVGLIVAVTAILYHVYMVSPVKNAVERIEVTINGRITDLNKTVDELHAKLEAALVNSPKKGDT